MCALVSARSSTGGNAGEMLVLTSTQVFPADTRCRERGSHTPEAITRAPQVLSRNHQQRRHRLWR
jgi:hypothetical protein